MAKKVGIDVGGTWLRAGVIDSEASDGGVSRFEKYPSPASWEDFTKIVSSYDKADIQGFGVAIAGPIDDHARVIKGPNLSWLEGRNVRGELEAVLRKTVVVSNDMEAATEGEMARGVLKQFAWAAFHTISTGWGGNLVLNGLRVDSEPGHVNVTFDCPYRCGSGHVGCREALYSGSGMENRINAHLRAPNALPSAEVWRAFDSALDEENDWALALLDDWAEGVGRAWANLLNQIRPLQAIIYMGKTAKSLLRMQRVQERLRDTLDRICMYPEHRRSDFPILPAQEEKRAIYGAVIVYDKVSSGITPPE
jgi:predicted NBD/HSP70 family sugar kinase